MRKTLSLLLLSSCLFAQKKDSYASLSIGTDVRNATLGSKPTDFKPALDLVVGVHAVSENLEINAEYEHFEKIGFARFGANIGYHINRWYIPVGRKDFDFTVVPSLGASIIERFGGKDHYASNGEFIYASSHHLALQAQASFLLKVSDRVILDWTVQALTRQDLQYLYPTDPNKFVVLSNYFKIHYILN